MIQKNWTATKTLRQSKLFIAPNRQKTNRILSLNKSSLSILTGLFTGHCPVKYHLRKLKRCDTDICRFCDYEIETSEHLLCSCVALYSRRRQFFNKDILSPLEIWMESPNKVVEFILRIIPDWGNSHYQTLAFTQNGNMPC